MGKSQRDKGYRTENNLRNILVDAGVQCRRVPLSGGAAGCPGDLAITIGDQERLAEVKCRADGFKQLYEWLSSNDFLFVKADRKDYLAVLRLDDLLKLLPKIGRL